MPQQISFSTKWTRPRKRLRQCFGLATLFVCLELGFLLLFAPGITFARADDSEGLNVGAGSPAVMRMATAEFVLEDSPEPPGTDAPWRTVSLPDDWRATMPTEAQSGWYRFVLPANSFPPGRIAVFLEKVNMSVEVWTQGVPRGPNFSGSNLPNDFNRPLLIELPRSNQASDADFLFVRLHKHAYHYGSLGPIKVGSYDRLASDYRRAHLVRIGFAQTATMLAVLAAAFACALWSAAGRDSIYGTFAWTAACCAVVSLNYWVRDLPLERWLWERLIHAALVGFAVGIALWSRRLLALRPGAMDRFLFFYLATGILIVLCLPVRLFYPGVNYLHGVSSAVAIYAGILILRNRGDLYPAERAFYSLGAVVGVVLCANDLFLQFSVFENGFPLFPYLMPLIVTIFAGSLVVRFRASLGQIEQMNLVLENRVAEKSEELSAHHERMRELEGERILLLERERLTREMHDGLGGQLVSALALVESEPVPSATVAVAIRTALADLRTVIDSLDPRIADFGMLVGLLRGRIAPLFDAGDIEIGWHVGDLPPTSNLGPENHLHVLRILQEAFSNAVRHSGATRIDFSTDWDGTNLTLRVEDDGSGLGNPPKIGRGLPNMKARAAAMGAELDVSSRTPGTCVELRMRAQ